jgi:hypothetical protein
MTEIIQCENCGAVLGKEDIFCGECGAPRPAAAAASAGPAEPAAQELQPVAEPAASVPPLVPPVSPSTPPSFSAQKGWRVAFLVLLVLGIIACVAGVASFLLLGSIPGENMTRQEDWLYAAVCCLVPIGGTGALLAAAGGVIWYARLRKS